MATPSTSAAHMATSPRPAPETNPRDDARLSPQAAARMRAQRLAAAPASDALDHGPLSHPLVVRSDNLVTWPAFGPARDELMLEAEIALIASELDRLMPLVEPRPRPRPRPAPSFFGLNVAWGLVPVAGVCSVIRGGYRWAVLNLAIATGVDMLEARCGGNTLASGVAGPYASAVALGACIAAAVRLGAKLIER